MKIFLKTASVLFHPLLIAVMSSALYFYLTPRFIDWEWAGMHLVSVAIITVAIPLVVYFILKSFRKVDTIYLRNIQERKYPLMIQSVLFLLLIKSVLNPMDNPELYYFFIGYLLSTFSALMMVFFRVKISLHQMGVAAILIFLFGLSVHFKIHLLITISFFLFANGWVASSRLLAKAHSYAELVVGFFIGAIPQFILYNFWL